MKGFDYSGRPPAPSAILAAGGHFICRYVCTPLTAVPSWKILLSKGEADAALAAGLDVVVVFESTKDRALSGTLGGRADAKGAREQVAAIFAEPAACPCYFAVDWDMQPSQRAAVRAYLDAAGKTYGRPLAGVYGGYDAVKLALDAGLVTYGWQTSAWSEGRWVPRAVLRQVAYHLRVGGTECDEDQAMAADFGQYRGAGSAGPPGVAGEDVTIMDAATKQYLDDMFRLVRVGDKDSPNFDPHDPTSVQGVAFKVDALRKDVDAIQVQLNRIEAAITGAQPPVH